MVKVSGAKERSRVPGVITYSVLVLEERVSIQIINDSMSVLIALNSVHEWK